MAGSVLYFGGAIVTMDGVRPEAEALVTVGGRIAGLGALADMQSLAGPNGRQVDLKGAALLPGFIEAHGHPMLSAQTVGDPVVDIRAAITPSYEQVMARIRRRVAKATAGEVVWFTGLDQLLHQDSHEPTREELDAISADVGIAVQTASLHAIYLNGAAVRAFGIAKDDGQALSDHIHDDAQGRPWKFTETATGPLMEGFARMCGAGRNVAGLADWLGRFSRAGYATVAETGLSPLMVSFYRALMERGPLPVRLFGYQYIGWNGKSPLEVGDGDDRFRIVGTKFWGDGSLVLGNVAVTRPYLNTEMTLRRMGIPADYTGALNYPVETLHWIMDAYAAQGHQLAVHAQGDATIDAVLDGFEKALANHPNARRPFRIEHCGLMRRDQVERAHALGVVCSFFVTLFHFWGDAMGEHLLGAERGERFVPFGHAAQVGMRASYHCDSPMTLPDPLLVLYAATTRKTRSGRVVGADQRVDIDTALRSITIDAAYHIQAEDRLGSLQVGKHADFTLLDRDPRTVAPDDLRSLRVLGVTVAGAPVWGGLASTTAA